MSYVYSVTIQTGEYGDSLNEKVAKLNDYLKDHNHLGGEFRSIPADLSAGTKCPNVELFWAGLNYLNTEEFVRFFKKVNMFDSLMTIASPESNFYTIVTNDSSVEVIDEAT